MKNLKALIGRLNDVCRRAFEGAAGLCLSKTNYAIEIEHVLLKLLDDPGNDVAFITQKYGVNPSRLQKELTAAIERFKTGNARTPSVSPQVLTLLSDAWLVGSLEFSSTTIRSGHLVLALLRSPELGPLITQSVRELTLIKPESLRDDFSKIVAASGENGGPAASAGAAEAAPAAGTKALDQFTIDLTGRAKAGQIDPVTGRDFEIRQVVDILMRRRQNNPILTGEAGVGKTAVVEGLALRIAEGDVPPPLKDVVLRTLDLGLLQAGAGIKGEFENRLKSVIQEVKASPKPIILFIDEAHTMIGSGGQEGQNDAANLLKPALARGELRTIAATTWAEYKQYFEKDAALARRFQVVKVEEPSPEQAVLMMRYLAPKLETHHAVRVLNEAVESAVRLTDRYLSGRQLPDKAVSVLDTACARLAINQSAVPGRVEDARRRVAALQHEIAVLEREQAITDEHTDRLSTQRKALEAAQSDLGAVEARWEKEKSLIHRIRDLRRELENRSTATAGQGNGESAAAATPPAVDLRKQLEQLTDELEALQGDQPLMQAVVNSQTIADVVSGWTGIPVGKMSGDAISTVMELERRLGERVLGQSHALAGLAERVRISRARLEDPRKPIGVFMLVGPSGVGKTETALALADTLFGGDQSLISINMSEYKEAHTISSLKGAPPGYVGYGKGGVLTEAVRRKPYSVVLLDEVEKAHKDVHELFFQVFDKGVLEDGEGRVIDFKNTVILLTSNVGTDTIMKMCADEETIPEPHALTEALRPELLKHFAPAFLGRLSVIPYYRISDSVLRQIIRLQLGRIASRIQDSHRAQFSYDDGVIEAIRARCTEVDSGARNVEHILMRTLLPELSSEILQRMANDERVSRVEVRAGDGGSFSYVVS
jgi:type VI secretion system protein VasG